MPKPKMILWIALIAAVTNVAIAKYGPAAAKA